MVKLETGRVLIRWKEKAFPCPIKKPQEKGHPCQRGVGIEDISWSRGASVPPLGSNGTQIFQYRKLRTTWGMEKKTAERGNRMQDEGGVEGYREERRVFRYAAKRKQ